MLLLLPLLQAHADSFHDVHIPYNAAPFTERSKSFSSSRNRSQETFVELNIGLASLYNYDFSQTAFPGASLLFGTTFSYSSLVYELQFGAAFPSILTGKIGLGIGSVDRNIMIAVRPFPYTIGPQLKIEQFTFSLEIGTANDVSARAGLIGTVGFRNRF